MKIRNFLLLFLIGSFNKDAQDYLAGSSLLEGKARVDMPAINLLAIKIPGFYVLELQRSQHANRPPNVCRVGVLTSSDEKHDFAANYNLEVNRNFRKPLDFNQFIESIQQLGLCWLVFKESPLYE